MNIYNYFSNNTLKIIMLILK